MKGHNNKCRLLAMAAVAIVLVVAPAVAATAVKETRTHRQEERQREALSYNDRRRFDYFFLEAACQQQKGNFAEAFELLNHCLEIDSTAAEAYFASAPYYSELGNDSLALACLKKAASLSPGNDTYQEHVAQYYIEGGDYDKAVTAYESLYSHHRDRSDVLNILFQLYRQKKDYGRMLQTIGRMEQVDGKSDETTLMKMGVYEMRGDRKMAYQMLKSIVDERPNEPSYKVMLGNWLMNHDRRDEAFVLFKSALADDHDNEFAQMSLYDYYRSAGNDSAAVRLRDHLLLSHKVDDKTKMSMLQQCIKENERQGGDSVPMLQLFTRVMAANPKNADIPYLKAAYMQLKKMPSDSIAAAFRHVLEVEPERNSARMELAQTAWQKQDWDGMIKLANEGTQYSPNEMSFYYIMGVAQFQKGNEDASLDALRRGVGEINAKSDHNMVSEFYALMGDILYKKHRPEEAFAAYDSCLQWKADNMMALNNYAYYLSELRRDLDKAEKMSRKTIEEEPTNATYLDTYAWILFLEKRYGEAKAYIDRALENDTDSAPSAVVIEHAGDIYAQCGDTDKAVELWQKAINAGGDNAALSKKIRLRKYLPAK